MRPNSRKTVFFFCGLTLDRTFSSKYVINAMNVLIPAASLGDISIRVKCFKIHQIRNIKQEM